MMITVHIVRHITVITFGLTETQHANRIFTKYYLHILHQKQN
jgi:hypothetical protein